MFYEYVITRGTGCLDTFLGYTLSMPDIDLTLMITQVEEEFCYVEEQCLKNKTDENEECDYKLHGLALITLYSFALNLKLSGGQLMALLYELDHNSRLYQHLIAPYLLLLDDMELVCKQYGHKYLRFLSEKAQDKSDEEVMKVLFTK